MQSQKKYIDHPHKSIIQNTEKFGYADEME